MWAIDLWLRRYRFWAPAPRPPIEQGRPVVVVTGGSEGIGLAIADRFAAAGHDLVLIARGADLLAAAAGDLARRHGVQVRWLPLDITAVGAAMQVDTFVRERGGYVDVLVNNAGVGLGGDFVAQDAADLDRLVDLNVRALTALTRHVLPGMLARGRGGIINIASLGGYAPGPYQAAYYASKAYVIALTQAVAHEVRGQGVRVCVVTPGPVETAFHSRMGAEAALYRLLVPSSAPRAVARSVYRGYRLGLGVVRPGLSTAPLALAMRLLPAILLLPLIGVLLRPRGDGNARR